MALVGFVDSAVFYWLYLQSKGPAEHPLWSRVALVMAIGVFTSFAHSKEPEKKP